MYTITTHKVYSYVSIITIPFENIAKLDLALCNQPTETPDSYYKRQQIKPDIVTNGGFFVMASGETCFGFRDEGISTALYHFKGVGITGDKTLTYCDDPKEDSSIRDFISAYPPLVVDGQKYNIDYAKEVDYTSRRTALGWDDKNMYLVIVDSPGCRYAPLQEIFMELKVKYAINFDGGGSTRLLLNGERQTSIAYARPVDNVFCVYLKKEEETTPKLLYRVQTGAFLLKDGAYRLEAELKEKGFTDIWVRKIGIYWKVQLGAFGVKLNAERLADRLQALGYKTYITTN